MKFFLHFKLLLLLFFINATTGYSQRYNFTNYHVSDGLPINHILCVEQMHNGQLWIGTMHGLSIFDGNSFTKLNNELILNTNPIKCINQDNFGNVWIGTANNGLICYRGNNRKLLNNNGNNVNSVNALATDSMGNVWVGTNHGVYTISDQLNLIKSNIKNLPSDTVSKIICDAKGNVWLATKKGLVVCRKNQPDQAIRITGLGTGEVSAICLDKQNTIWIGVQNDLYNYNGNLAKVHIINPLSNTKITSITQDINGQLWIATNNEGIGKLVKNYLKMYAVKHGLANNRIQQIKSDREGNLWMATLNGLSKFSGDRFIAYTTNEGLSNNDVLSLFVADSNHVWVGTNAGGLNLLSNNGIAKISNGFISPVTTVFKIIRDANANYWFATSNGLVKYNEATKKYSKPIEKLSNKVIYTILESSNGKMYFGTDMGLFVLSNRGLEVINTTNGLVNAKIKVLYEDDAHTIWIGTQKGLYYLLNNKLISFNSQYKIPLAPITSIIADKQQHIVFTTYGMGAYVFNKTNAQAGYQSISTKNGLKNDLLLFGFIDSVNQIWFGDSYGLNKFYWPDFLKKSDLKIEYFNTSNGYSGLETNTACADPNGDIWFGSVNGLMKYNIESKNPVSITPLISINKLQLLRRDINWQDIFDSLDFNTGLPKRLILNHDQNHIGFSFQGIYLTAPQELRYCFMLKGFDDDWMPPTQRNDAYYVNLPPGEYLFKVKASVNGYEWSNPTSYFFIIATPWWKTKLAYFFYTVSFAGLIYSFLKHRTKNLENSKNALSQKVIERTRELNRTNLELSKISLVASETSNAVLIFNSDLILEYANAGFTKMTGYQIEEFVKLRGDSIYKITYFEHIETIVTEALRDKKSMQYESIITRKDGSKIWSATTLTPIFNTNGNLKNIVLIDTDIDSIKQIEQQLMQSFEERGLLLKEIHHRVKNNLQIIISLFNLQSNFIDDAVALKALREGQNRIKSMALVHERFYQSEGLSKIDFDVYIHRLAETLFSSYNISPEKIKLNIEAEKISLDIDTAIPCGLILNELINNSIKHAFNENQQGEISVQFYSLNEETCRLIIGDNGKGMAADFDFENAETLGMQLITALTQQIDGKLKIEHNNGLKFIIDFKKQFSELI